MDLVGGATGSACVPSTAGNPAASSPAEPAMILDEVARELSDAPFDTLADLDAVLRKFDGVNAVDAGVRPGFQPAIRGASIAAARAMAANAHVPLWRFLAAPDVETRLPVPQFTVINGCGQAGTALDFEEFMVVPVGAPSMRDAVRAGADIHRRLRTVLEDSGLATRVGDDGGFVPEIDWPERVLELIVETAAEAGYALGSDGVAIALRVGAAGFRRDGSYRMAGEWLSSAELVARYEQMAEDFPLWSIEDGLAPDDWAGWTDLTRRLGDRIQLVGSDIFATDAQLIATAVANRVANAALIAITQYGTVTETLEAMRACREAGYAHVLAHRGETTDTFIADLAVATGCGQLKGGAPIQGERVANYNRLIEIESIDGLVYGV